jgi:hypothetical protein
MQLGVHRNSDEAAPPAGKQRLDVGRTVAQGESDARAPPEPKRIAETMGDRGGTARERGVIGDYVHPDDDSGTVRVHAACPR